MDELTPSEQGELEVLSRMPLTDAGQARLEALRQKAGQSPPADELTALRQQLTAAQAVLVSLSNQRDRLRAALEDIAQRGPESKPIEDSDYAWDNLSEGRELSIASAHYVYGDELAWWNAAQIARQALDETVTPKDVPNRGGDVANGAGKEDSVR